jgi:prolyl-tRNA synthetase
MRWSSAYSLPMRMTQLLGSTLRAAPAGAESPGYQLLLRGAFVRQLGQGLFSFLPLGTRVKQRVEHVLRQEMDAVGGAELLLPLVHPAEIWKRSGRYDTIGPELVRFDDRRTRPHVLALTHEEVVATLAASEVQSWRQLPRFVYQIQLKFRDDPRPRGGLLRVREFTMKDGYTLDRDEAGLDEQYARIHGAYLEIFRRCGLPVIPVAADVGMMGGREAHEFMYLTPIGEDTVVLCDGCGYAQNRQVATAARPPVAEEDPLPIERVETPDADTIDRLTQVLGIPAERTAKALFMATSDGRMALAVVRGDMQLNETKLAGALGAAELRPMTPEEIEAIGAVAGYGSPVGIGSRAVVVVDELVARSPNLVAGANEPGFHLANVNVGRDFSPDVVADIVAVEAGQPCAACGGPLRTERAVETGNIFKLGTRYAGLGASYLGEDGEEKPIVMGSYGIGVDRLIACIAEEHHDERGLVWPASVAPFAVHVCALGDEGLEAAGAIAENLEGEGLDVLVDDRGERAGVQFADAELIGCPVQVTVSKRSLAAGGVEVKLRSEPERPPEVVPPDELASWVRGHLEDRATEAPVVR